MVEFCSRIQAGFEKTAPMVIESCFLGPAPRAHRGFSHQVGYEMRIPHRSVLEQVRGAHLEHTAKLLKYNLPPRHRWIALAQNIASLSFL